MKYNIFLIVLLTLAGCSTKRDDQVIMYKLEISRDIKDVRKGSAEATFTKAFLYYLVEKFPAATQLLFSKLDSVYFPTDFTDTSHVYAIISRNNRVALINVLPVNLSKAQSDGYFKWPGFFQFKDSADRTRRDSIFDARTKWSPAPPEIEKQYLQFYAMLNDGYSVYCIEVPKQMMDAAPW